MVHDHVNPATVNIPFPPYSLRQLVGPTDTAAFDNPARLPLFPDVPLELYASVFDFGCGCGRQARQLMLQEPRPEHYVGIDIHEEMIAWCQRNLTPIFPEFTFYHHDVYNRSLNPTSSNHTLAFPVPPVSASLILAYSVFTHLLESQIAHYLQEASRILRDDGLLLTTWFLFNKRAFPMMQPFQNALYINTHDPTNAVIVDQQWLAVTALKAGLTITKIIKPAIRGFQWYIYFSHSQPGQPSLPWPEDNNPFGSVSADEGITIFE